MKTFVVVEGKVLGLNHVNSKSVGYGHKKITVELYYNDDYQEFTATTNNMPGYDAASELEGDVKYLAFYELIKNKIYDEVVEWLKKFE